MLTEQNLRCRDAEAFLNERFYPELIAKPRDHSFPENSVRARKALHAGEQQSLELNEWLFEESDIIEISRIDRAGFETEINGVLGKIVVVLLAGETLFLGCRNELSVAEKSSRCIVKITGDS